MAAAQSLCFIFYFHGGNELLKPIMLNFVWSWDINMPITYLWNLFRMLRNYNRDNSAKFGCFIWQM